MALSYEHYNVVIEVQVMSLLYDPVLFAAYVLFFLFSFLVTAELGGFL